MSVQPQSRFVVVTGGPGAGKTTLIEQLRRERFACAPEGGRAIIQDQVAIGGAALPWRDPGLFAELMLAWDLRSYRHATEYGAAGSAPVFFDRGVVDVIGYLRLMRLPVPPHLHAAAQRFRYDRRVFVAPHWPEIYRRDDDRRQTPEEAERTFHACVAAYTDYGYEPVLLPRTAVTERARFVLDALGHAAQKTR
ncbi:AAA family ATPase [Actinoallomurus sp. NPDC052274]|uniref:AAA family ATPase n=1 Tax=Actinoallomurus sp. NPDC052274 TaxID=3155420 RepID=UPI00342EE8CF